MPSDKNRGFIFGIMVLVLAAGTISDVVTDKAKATDSIPRRFAATVFFGLTLMALAGPAPKIAKGLAALIGVSFLFASPGGTVLVERIGIVLNPAVASDFGGGGNFGTPNVDDDEDSSSSGGGSAW